MSPPLVASARLGYTSKWMCGQRPSRQAGKIVENVDLAAAVGLLHSAQVVLVGDAVGIERVTAFSVALPQVDRSASESSASVGLVEN